MTGIDLEHLLADLSGSVLIGRNDEQVGNGGEW